MNRDKVAVEHAKNYTAPLRVYKKLQHTSKYVFISSIYVFKGLKPINREPKIDGEDYVDIHLMKVNNWNEEQIKSHHLEQKIMVGKK